MFDNLIDSLVARLMAAAGLIVAAAISAVTAAMAVYAFLAPHLGAAWSYVILSGLAGLVVTIWSLAQRQHKRAHRQPPIETRILETLQAHPTAGFLAGLAAGALVKGKPGEAKALWASRRS